MSNPDYVAERLVRLICIGFKEATMDSPSFRASINYMHVCIINSNTLINSKCQLFHDYIDTLTQLSKVVQNLNDPLIKKLFSLLNLNSNILALFNQLIEVEIPNYFELRKSFEKTQSKYDQILSSFMQLPRSTDPLIAREDAFQLYEIRKQYIELSLNLWVSIKNLDLKIKNLLCLQPLPSSFLSNNNSSFKNLLNGLSLDDYADYYNSLKSEIMNLEFLLSSTNLLQSDLEKSRENSQNNANKLFTPSNLTADYLPVLDKSFLSNESDLLEKHGWVFIKSDKLNNLSGTVWIKRWLFIKNNTFGFLSISPDGQFVQESDKFSIDGFELNIPKDENKNFVFQIKHKNQLDLTIQIESSIELKSWLTVFNNALKASSGSSNLLKRFPPVLPMLKLTPIVAKDLEIVSNTLENENSLKKIEDQLKRLPNIKIDPPLTTSLTSQLVMAHMYISSSSIPSAVTANFWGYINWGIYFLRVDEETPTNRNKRITNELIELKYPPFYPNHLRFVDAELRSIFETKIRPDELTLLKFNCTWSPNLNQKLYCTTFVTTNSFYIYSHVAGLISISPISLSFFLTTEITEKINLNYNILKISFLSGLSIKINLYYSIKDSTVIKNKFNYILSNRKSKHPDNLKTLIENLHNNFNADVTGKPNNLVMGIKSIDKKSLMNNDYKIDYSSNMILLLAKNVNLPVKSLFHILFGDDSLLLDCVLPFSSGILQDFRIETQSKNSFWRCNSKQELTRVVWNPLYKFVSAKQTIEVIDNNKYYNILQETPYYRLVFGFNKKIYTRFVLTEVDSKNSKLFIYHAINNDKKPKILNWFTETIIYHIMLFRINALNLRLDESIRLISKEQKKISSAIKIFGPITKYDSEKMTKDEKNFKTSVNFIPLQLFSMFYYEKAQFEIGKFFKTSIIKVLRIMVNCMKFVNIHKFLVGTLTFSLILNILLVGKTNISYWRERNLSKNVQSILSSNSKIERSISLKEIDDLLYNHSHTKLKSLSFSANGSDVYWNFMDVAKLNSNPVDTEISLSKQLNGLRLERNEILSKLNLINYMEYEFLLKEWNNWIISELANCQKVASLYPEIDIEDYCKNVELEMNHLYTDLL